MEKIPAIPRRSSVISYGKQNMRSSLIDAGLVCGLMSQLVAPEWHWLGNVPIVVSDSIHSHRHFAGISLIKAKLKQGSLDEHGFVSIHWPHLLAYAVHNKVTATYLREAGCDVLALQNTPVQALWSAYNQFQELEAGLSAILPPGSLLKPPSALHRQIYAHADKPTARASSNLPEQNTEQDDPEITWEMQALPWSVFRFGALTNTVKNSFQDVVADYQCLSALSICELDTALRAKCPTLINLLIAVFKKARNDKEGGWTKWGLAWTRAGLVFNTRIAVMSLLVEDPDYLKALLPTGHFHALGQWELFDYYLQATAIAQLPRLVELTQINETAHNYMTQATAPFEYLYTDSFSIYQNASSRVLFPIKPNNEHTLLSYFETLHKLSRNKEYASYDIKTAPEQTHYKLKSQYIPAKERTRIIYDVRFNAYNLSSVAPAVDVEYAVLPFDLSMIEYKHEYYFSYPKGLTDLFPELEDKHFYENNGRTQTLQWQQAAHNKWKGTYTPLKLTRTKHHNFVRLTFPVADTNDYPLTRSVDGRVFFHPYVFSPQGHAWSLLGAIVAKHPGVSPDPNSPEQDQIRVFRNFWDWVYNPMPGVKAGVYEGEFLYPLGFQTQYCPKESRLNTQGKRLQFIIDKAKHSLDDKIAFIPPEQRSKKTPRSKAPSAYDKFLFWYVPHHEIAQLPWQLDPEERAEYFVKRWTPWRGEISARKHLEAPYEKPKHYDHPKMEQVLDYARRNFGQPFSQLQQ